MFTWACSDNIDFGEKEAARFTDRLETGPDALRAVNRHNNKVGREVSYHKFFCNYYNVTGLYSLSQGNVTSFCAYRPKIKVNWSRKKMVVITNLLLRDFNVN